MTSDANSPKSRRRSFWLLTVGVPALVLLLVVAVGSLYMGRAGSQRFETAASAAQKDDPYWRLEDLMAHRETVPDGENAAMVVARVAELLPEDWQVRAATGTGAGAPSAAKKTVLDVIELLRTTDANLAIDEAAAGKMRKALKESEEALTIARTVANYKRGRHELVIGPIVIDTLLPETQRARSVARILEVDALLRAHDGDLDGALDSCRAIIGVSRSIGDEPTLISALVRIAIDSIAVKSIERVLGQGQPTEAALERLQALVLDEHAQPLLLIGMKGERAMLDELIRRIEDGKVPMSAILSTANTPSGEVPLGDRLVGVLARGVLGGQRATALEWMNQAVAISRRPTFEQPALWAEWDQRIADVRQSRLSQVKAILPLMLLPATRSASTAFARSQTELGATAILIAAERQRRRTGKWPASIEAIDPSILAKAPVDPFSGKPFRFALQHGELVIYSIGPDGKDEQGKFDPKLWIRGGPDDVGARAWDVKYRAQRMKPPAK